MVTPSTHHYIAELIACLAAEAAATAAEAALAEVLTCKPLNAAKQSAQHA
jgi:hypothetical protein